MAKIIIVDGPDGAGKTTLVNRLMQSFTGSRYVHFGVPEDHTKQFELYKNTLLEALSTETLILDRSWYSDRVYAPVMRKREEMSFTDARELDRYVLGVGGGMLIHCTATSEKLWKRCCARGETYIENEEQLRQLADAFNTEVETSLLPVVHYDTTLLF